MPSHHRGQWCITGYLQANPATGLVRLSGDAAQPTPQGDASWLQALADWRQPVLLTTADRDGAIPARPPPPSAGNCMRCWALQLNGPGTAQHDTRDGLSWLGWIPDEHHPEQAECLDALARRLQFRSLG